MTMNIIYKNKNIQLAHGDYTSKPLTMTQAQNILMAMDYDKDVLFEAITAMEENNWNIGYLGICGSFLFGESI